MYTCSIPVYTEWKHYETLLKMKCLVSENKKQRDRYIGKRFSLDNMVMEAARKQKLIEKPSSTGGLANAYFSFRVKLQPKVC